jgi:hypothetical protein
VKSIYAVIFALGWIVMPIAAAFAGWRYGSTFEPKGSAEVLRSKADALSSNQRLWLGGAAIWVALCTVFFAVFHPLGYYWTSVEWAQFLFVCGAPKVHYEDVYDLRDAAERIVTDLFAACVRRGVNQ